MKKYIIITVVSIFVVLSIILGIYTVKSLFPEMFENYKGWKSVAIQDYGSIKIPPNWELEEKDGFIQFYSGKNENNSKKYTLVQYANDSGIVNGCFGDVIERKWLFDINYGNSAGFKKNNFVYSDGNVKEYSGISLFKTSEAGGDTIYFYLLDASVSENILKKIAISYEMN